MRIYKVIPGEVEVDADGYEIHDTGALLFYDEDDLVMAIWAPNFWHRVEVLDASSDG